MTILNTNIPMPPAPATNRSPSSGGGSAGWLSLLLLPLAFVRRRMK
ncbi:GlyGly-CTERM sorting domain-containing protein [Alteromonadaceae bacterium M269]|nr:GlyGly-CTERM sorting domain-containing protein [Alteromonadaceae bacterium M269]